MREPTAFAGSGVRDAGILLEQKVRERTAALQESEERYRRLAELCAELYWEQDEHGQFTKIFGPVLEMLGAGGDEAGAACWNEAERKALQSAIAARRPFLDFALSSVNADGSRQVFRISGEPILNSACRFVGYRGIGVAAGASVRNPT